MYIELIVLQKENLCSSKTILKDRSILKARWLINIVADDLWIQISAFTKQADTELIVVLKESYIPLQQYHPADLLIVGIILTGHKYILCENTFGIKNNNVAK